MIRRRLVLLLASATLAVTAAGCPSQKRERPTIRITSPESGSTINSSAVTVTVAVTNFEINDVIQPIDPQPFKGHWHLYIDLQFAGSVYTTAAVISSIPPGLHTFYAELANENDFPVSGVDVPSIDLDFPLTAPGIHINTPVFGSLLNSSSTDVDLDIANFTLDSAAIGAANVAGTGHYHYYLNSLDDSDFIGEDARTVGTITKLDSSALPGPTPQLNIWVQLVNNDHTPLDPPVFDETVLVVPTDAPRIFIEWPTPGMVVGSAFDLGLAVANFSLVDFSGAPADTAGQGHFRVLVDGSEIGAAFTTTSSGWATGATGKHRVRAELVSNTGAPLVQPVVDEVIVQRP